MIAEQFFEKERMTESTGEYQNPLGCINFAAAQQLLQRPFTKIILSAMQQKSPKKYDQLRNELSSYLTTLSKAEEVILAKEVSSFPIFVIHQHTIDIGINIVDKDKVNGNWSVNASTLEEFVTKQILSPEKIDDFKLVYKNHEGELCLFVLSELGANFIFLPKHQSATPSDN